MMALSEYFMETGDFAEARRHAEAIGDAGTASPHENLARIALAEGDLAVAEKEARAALERYPSRRIPRQILGRVLHDRGDYPGALMEFDLAARPRGSETAVPLQNLQFLRGDCLARLGRLREAEAAFQDEIRLFPSNAAPRAALAMLYASQGRETEARRALSELVGLRTPEAYFTASRTYEILGDSASAGELRAEAKRLFPAAKDRGARSTG
jgi:tetratricopeptide (TPR) repeat protein